MPAPPWFLVVYALSGAAALVYEVAWTRLLTLHLGHGIAAASTVLAAFMGGLAIGAALAGPASDRLPPARALRWYALAEIAIALLALAMPLGLAAFTPLLSGAYGDGGGVLFAVLRLVTAVVLVALPAVAMGATFPLVARWYVPAAAVATRRAGALYAANTLGAAAGAIATGFVLLPQLGLRATTWMGVALNLAVAAVAWLAAGRTSSAAAPAPLTTQPAARKTKARDAGPAPPPPARVWVAAAGLGISGFLSLALQVIWTRLLAQILGPTTYAFSLVVALFILGLAVGALAGRLIASRTRQAAAGLAWCIALAVIGAGIAAATVDRGLLSVAAAVAAPTSTFESVLNAQLRLVAVWLGPLAIALGATFPFAVKTGTGRDTSLGADLGLIYAVNTLGAIAGALAAGFVLIPRFGVQPSLRGLGVAAGAAAALLALRAGLAGAARLSSVAIALAAIGVSVWWPGWDPVLMSSGAYKYAGGMSGPALQTQLLAGRLLYYHEGALGAVAVRDAAGTTSLAIDGKVDASNAGDMLTQRLLAHVPLLLHPSPKRAAIIGLGSGVTAGAALTHPLERLDVLEISPEVVEGSRFFEPENHRALADRRTRLLVADGRTHLTLGRAQYDVIVSEPSNPWMAGIATLFTREFFASAKARLAPGGVLCQWAHTYDISAEDLRSIVGTFASVFPNGTLWLVGDGDVLLIGSTEPLDARIQALPTVWSARGDAVRDLATVGARDPYAVLSLFVASGRALTAFGATAPMQTDDHPGIEYSGPRAVFSRRGSDNAGALRALAAEQTDPAIDHIRREASALSLRDRGWMLLDASSARPAWDDFARAVQADPHDPRALEGLLRAGAAAGRQAETAKVLQDLAARPENLEAQLSLSRFLAASGQVEDAARLAFEVAAREPSHVGALEQLASVLSDVGDRDRLEPVVARLRTVAPTTDAARYYTAVLLFMSGRTEPAIAEARALVKDSPGHARAFNLLGAALATSGQRDAAREAFQASIKAEPRDPSTYTNLALLELEGGNRVAGIQRLAEALTLDPSSQAAGEALAREAARGPLR